MADLADMGRTAAVIAPGAVVMAMIYTSAARCTGLQ